MSYDIYTKQYLDFLDKFYDKINLRSDKPLEEIFDFILHKASQSPVILDLFFAVGLVKIPEEIFIRIKSRKRLAFLTLGEPGEFWYHRTLIVAEIPGKGRITDQAAREALLSKHLRDCYLKVPRLIGAAEKIILTCKKIERVLI